MQPQIVSNDEFMHYGILGMRWGIRRYQDKNGRLTKLGKKRLEEAQLNNRRYDDPNPRRRLEDVKIKKILF